MATLTRPSRWTIAAITGFVGVGAIFGGYGLLSDAEGLGAKRAWLEGSPFPDYRVPGLVLLVLIGGGMLTTGVLALRRSRFAGPAALAMGVALLLWGLVETVTLGYQGGAQLLLLAVFVLAPALALLKFGRDASASALRGE